MSETELFLWVLAFGLFVGGDWVTTRWGRSRSGVVERNPVARAVIARVGFPIAFFVLKGLALGVGLLGFFHAGTVPETRPYRALFPVIFIGVGALITLVNLRVLRAVR